MRMAKRAVFAWPSSAGLGLAGLAGLRANLAQAAAPPERVLPDSTVFFLKVNDVNALREAFRQSQYGQLWNDPALKDFRDDLAAKLEDASKTLKEKIGVTLRELLELPQGRRRRSRRSRQDDPKLPVAAGDHRRRRQERREDDRGPEPEHQAGRGGRRQGQRPRRSRA